MNVKHLTAFVTAIVAAVPATAATAQSAGSDWTGAQAIGLALRRMATTGRVLMIGAHPDDENTSVLATLALRDGADVGYLSLTRGDGGQNLIGPELKEGLGLIRTDELLAARRIDGARQFFSRAYDFGYSKSADEAFRHWPRDSVLADAVAVIRAFRPDVILSVWSGTPRDGHGQHQAAGIIAREAFAAAADPARFKDQIAAGLEPHRARYLFQSSWRPAGDVAFWIETGGFDPLFGRSSFQISMESRSLHRSQDQGSAQPPGPQRTAILALAGPVPDPVRSVFDGIETTLPALARSAGAPAGLIAELDAWSGHVSQATISFNPLHPDSIVAPLQGALAALERADSILDTEARPGGPVGRGLSGLRFRIRAERSQAVEALRLAAGVVLDATADDPRVVPGQAFVLTLRLWNGGRTDVTIDRLEPLLPAGWVAAALDPPAAGIAPAGIVTRRFQVQVPHDAAPSEPYHLTQPRRGSLYSWPDDWSLRGQPFGPSAVRAVASVRLGNSPIELETDATYVDVDKAMGELRLPVLVVPSVSVALQPRVAVIPLGVDGAGTAAARAREVSVTIRSESTGSIAGTVRLVPAAGWQTEPAGIPVRFESPGEQQTVHFTVIPPLDPAPGRHEVSAVFEMGETAIRRGFTTIHYPHTQPRLLFRDAVVLFTAFPVAVAPDLRVGYIEGAGDDVASALAQLGVAVESLDADAVTSGDLARYDVIVAGIRAYEVRQDLVAANRRLLDWVEAGGTYVVQYNKQEFVRGGFAPYPLSMGQSADRVTDEESPVTLLAPGEPPLDWPNRIGPADFDDWVQERGLYFPDGWDERYVAPLEMNDPGEAPVRGSLLVARYGAGAWVYTGLSFFRQVPEGVPGAYRLLANLVSLGKMQR